MKKTKQMLRKEPQHRTRPSRSKSLTSESGPAIPQDTAAITNALRTVKFKVFAAPTSAKRGKLSEKQGLKRFASLSMKNNKGLIERLAADYAKIFNAGLVVKSVGLETYFLLPDGKETHYFSSLTGIEKAPERKTSKHDEDNLVKRMRAFYKSISMNDPDARSHFVKTLREKLSPTLLPLLNQAIMSSR